MGSGNSKNQSQSNPELGKDAKKLAAKFNSPVNGNNSKLNHIVTCEPSALDSVKSLGEEAAQSFTAPKMPLRPVLDASDESLGVMDLDSSSKSYIRMKPQNEAAEEHQPAESHSVADKDIQQLKDQEESREQKVEVLGEKENLDNQRLDLPTPSIKCLEDMVTPEPKSKGDFLANMVDEPLDEYEL